MPPNGPGQAWQMGFNTKVQRPNLEAVAIQRLPRRSNLRRRVGCWTFAASHAEAVSVGGFSVFFSPEGRVAESGLRHSTRNRAWGNPPWVRIPPLPLPPLEMTDCTTTVHNKVEVNLRISANIHFSQNRRKLRAFASRAPASGLEHHGPGEMLNVSARFALPPH